MERWNPFFVTIKQAEINQKGSDNNFIGFENLWGLKPPKLPGNWGSGIRIVKQNDNE